MLGTNFKHSLAIVTVTAGLLAAAGPASAHGSDRILYNGHAGLGAVTDGTSNTIMFGVTGSTVIEPINTKYTLASPLVDDRAPAFLPEVDDEVL